MKVLKTACSINKRKKETNTVSLEMSIKTKGKFNIRSCSNELEIMNIMEAIKYGWMDKNNNKHDIVDETYSNNYRLQSPKEIIKNKIGVCWDQVELERYYFQKNDYNFKTYFLVYYDNKVVPTHTFLTFEKNNKFYWFEHSWERFRGIHEYGSIKELLLDVRKKFIMNELDNNYNQANLILREYKKPKYGISVPEFYKHCESGKIINVNRL